MNSEEGTGVFASFLFEGEPGNIIWALKRTPCRLINLNEISTWTQSSNFNISTVWKVGSPSLLARRLT